ncbi:NADH-quinone oxidoreductase subunit I [bacterium]|nr:NADH-quinone oxidoreductase subunit I [bacterium]
MKKLTNAILQMLLTLWSVLKSLWITFLYFWRKKVTVQYPEEKREHPPRYRASVDVDVSKCIACGICQRVCPSDVIEIEVWKIKEDDKEVRKPRNFNLNLGRCMVCGLCAEYCPTGAIRMTQEYELASYEREGLIRRRA